METCCGRPLPHKMERVWICVSLIRREWSKRATHPETSSLDFVWTTNAYFINPWDFGVVCYNIYTTWHISSPQCQSDPVKTYVKLHHQFAHLLSCSHTRLLAILGKHQPLFIQALLHAPFNAWSASLLILCMPVPSSLLFPSYWGFPGPTYLNWNLTFTLTS